MKTSRIKKAIALLVSTSFVLSYTVFPADGISTVFASGKYSSTASANASNSSAPTVTAHPQNLTAKPGDIITFTVSASGTGTLKYQWYYKKLGASDWSEWKNHTSASTEAMTNSTWNMIKIRCKITDDNGSVYSDAATVVIDQPLTILTQPKDVTVKVDQPTKFSVSAQGKGAIAYQWYYKKAGASDWSVWKGRTSAKITSTSNSTWNMMQVRCRITDDAGSIDSDAATITVDQPLSILTQPKDVTTKTEQKVKFSVKAQGKGTLKYQWYYQKEGSTSWSIWNRLTAASVVSVSNPTWNLMKVRCKVTDDSGSIYSDAAVVTIDQPLTIITQPKDIVTKVGNVIKLSVKAQGTGALTYQWYHKKNGASGWTLWDNHTTATTKALVNSTWDGIQLYCVISDAAGHTVKSDPAIVITSENLKIIEQPEEVLLESGDTASFSVRAYGAGTLSYQWYYKKAGKSDWIEWSGKTTPEISAVADCTWHGMQVYCKVTDSKNKTVNSNTTYAMITKQGDKRYFSRTITVKKNSTKIYTGVGTGTQVITTVPAKRTFTVLEWDNDSNDTTWYSFNYNGRIAWIPRTSVSSTINYTGIPDRKFKDGGIPVIYLSPSRQTANLYAVGNTTEQQQMYRVANVLKKILEEEYYCTVYIPSTGLKLGLKNRAYDAYIRDADVYLAIHSNSLSNGVKMHGATGFYFPACNQSLVLAQNIVNEMGKIEFQKSSVKNKLVNGMTAFDNTGYGEVRDPSYYGMIGVLAEVEYHHYDTPARWIINNTDRIARALANSLEKTLEMQKK